MDKICFDIEGNFTLYVNECIEQFLLAIEKNDQKHYKFSLIFAGITIELGLALIVEQGMKINIYNKDKKTFNYQKIKDLFKNGLDEHTKNIFKEYVQIEYDPIIEHPTTNIHIKTEILENEITSVKTARNDLVHSKGAIPSADIEHLIFSSLLFLNMVLPNEYKFHQILHNKAIIAYLEHCTDEEMLTKISNAFEIFQAHDDEHYISLIQDIMYDCVYCGYHSMINICGHNSTSPPGYLCVLCISHGYLKNCILCSNWIPHGEEFEWNDEHSEYACEACYNNWPSPNA